jgi:hypothetical protein
MRAHVAVALVLPTLLGGCGSAKVKSDRALAATPAQRPAVVYVTDFELDAANVHAERGILPTPPPLPGLGEVLPKLPGTPREPASRARDIVELMSKSLVKDLDDKGLATRRLARGESLPAYGWLVRGVFTNVQEGNQLRRAVIGFGAGSTDLQVLVTIDDLATGAPKPLYEVQTSADSGKLPGAVITLNPYVAAARFVLAGGDLDRNVKQTAAQIAEQTARRVKTTEPAARAQDRKSSVVAGSSTSVTCGVGGVAEASRRLIC